jgi:hypothetical protein
LNIEECGSLIEAQFVVEAWHVEYNAYRPTRTRRSHPRRYAERCNITPRAAEKVAALILGAGFR